MATAKKASAKKAAPAAKKSATTTTAQTARGRDQDRKLISAKQKYEISYEAEHDGRTAAEVKAAIEKLGHSRVKVRRALTAKK